MTVPRAGVRYMFASCLAEWRAERPCPTRPSTPCATCRRGGAPQDGAADLRALPRQMIGENWKRNADLDPDEVQKLVDEEVAASRRERRTRAQAAE